MMNLNQLLAGAKLMVTTALTVYHRFSIGRGSFLSVRQARRRDTIQSISKSR